MIWLRRCHKSRKSAQDTKVNKFVKADITGTKETFHNSRKIGSLKAAQITRGHDRRNVSVPLFNFSNTEEKLFRNAVRNGLPENDEVAHCYGYSLTRKQIRGLASKEWLNDDIINFTFSIWNEIATLNDTRNLFVCTFFMDQLQGNGIYGFSNVRSWFHNGEDIKDNSILFIPININNTHWTLLVINMEEKSLKYYDGLRGNCSFMSQYIIYL